MTSSCKGKANQIHEISKVVMILILPSPAARSVMTTVGAANDTKVAIVITRVFQCTYY